MNIVKFDCTAAKGQETCSSYGVQGFPTLKWFDAEGKASEYNGGRGEEDIVNWVSGKMGSAKKAEGDKAEL